MRTGAVLVCILIYFGSLAGCAGSRAKDDGGPITLYTDDSGRAIKTTVGTMIYITLDGNPTTGYTWEIKRADPQVLFPGDHEFHPSSDMPGAGGVWVFPFEAGAKGTSDIRLIYHRPWENDEPLRTFKVSVEVR